MVVPSSPMIALAVVLGALYAAVFHTIKGKTLVELPLFVAASLAGFATGELAAQSLHLNLLTIGELHLVEATAGSILFLFIARWLKV